MLNRLRQRDAKGSASVAVAITQSNNSVIRWNATRNDLGSSQSIYDEATIQEFIRRTKLTEFKVSKARTSPSRNAANFRPVRISEVIKGNAVYDGQYQAAFGVLNTFPLVEVKGPVSALAPVDASSCPYLPTITHTAFPNVYMPRANYCLQQAANSASEAVHDFGVTLGEMAETVAMLLNPLKAISSLCKNSWLLGAQILRDRHTGALFVRPSKAVKQFQRKTGMQKAKSSALAGCYVINQASNFWLTWRFGVKPALKEINDIMGMSYIDYESSDLKLARKKIADEWTTRSGSTTVSLGGYYMYADVFDTVRYRTSSQATYAYSVKHGFGLSDFFNSTGLSLRHLPQVLWELVPCSFVLDRFLDVGSFIRALTPDPGVKTIDTCMSEKVEVILDRKVTSCYRLYRQSTNYLNPINRKLRIWNFRYARDVGAPVPILPQFNPKLLKIEQLVDHATLVWQRLPKWR